MTARLLLGIVESTEVGAAVRLARLEAAVVQAGMARSTAQIFAGMSRSEAAAFMAMEEGPMLRALAKRISTNSVIPGVEISQVRAYTRSLEEALARLPAGTVQLAEAASFSTAQAMTTAASAEASVSVSALRSIASGGARATTASRSAGPIEEYLAKLSTNAKSSNSVLSSAAKAEARSLLELSRTDPAKFQQALASNAGTTTEVVAKFETSASGALSKTSGSGATASTPEGITTASRDIGNQARSLASPRTWRQAAEDWLRPFSSPKGRAAAGVKEATKLETQATTLGQRANDLTVQATNAGNTNTAMLARTAADEASIARTIAQTAKAELAPVANAKNGFWSVDTARKAVKTTIWGGAATTTVGAINQYNGESEATKKVAASPREEVSRIVNEDGSSTVTVKADIPGIGPKLITAQIPKGTAKEDEKDIIDKKGGKELYASKKEEEKGMFAMITDNPGYAMGGGVVGLIVLNSVFDQTSGVLGKIVKGVGNVLGGLVIGLSGLTLVSGMAKDKVANTWDSMLASIGIGSGPDKGGKGR